jgi:hypothetical protein
LAGLGDLYVIRFGIFLVASAVITACGKQDADDRLASSPDTASLGQQVSSEANGPPPNESIKSDYPYSIEWIPGQRDTEDFDVLSKFRAHANRLSKEVLVLTLDTPATGSKAKQPAKFLVADSTVITGLSPGELFRNDCRMGSSGPDGRITGVPSTNIWERWQHPRFAWQFDTVSLTIRTLPGDSVQCMLVEVDD